MSTASDRVAVVTGSARKFGRATSLKLSQMGVSSIVVHARQDRTGVDETVAVVKEANANAIANCIVPGMVETARGSAAGANPSQVFKHKTLIGREGHPEEVAHVNAMLCHEDAAFTTDQTVHVSGGAYLA